MRFFFLSLRRLRIELTRTGQYETLDLRNCGKAWSRRNLLRNRSAALVTTLLAQALTLRAQKGQTPCPSVPEPVRTPRPEFPPIETGARKRRVRQPGERDVVEDVVAREAGGFSRKAA